MKVRMNLVWCVMAGVLLHQTAAAEMSPERASLKELKAVAVIVGVQSRDAAFRSLADSSGLQTKLELVMRQSRVKVVELVTSLQEDSIGTLELSVLAVPQYGRDEHGDPLAYAVAVHLKLSQVLWTYGEKLVPRRAIVADTWSRLVVLTQGSTVLRDGGLKDAVADLAEEFANDWLAAHAK